MQKRYKFPSIVVLFAMALAVIFVAIPSSIASIQGAAPTVSMKVQSEETVLWAVHQGSFESAPDVYHQLREIADSFGLKMTRPEGSWTLLNKVDADKDRLIEVQIPVDHAALALNDNIRTMAAEYGLTVAGTKLTEPAVRAQVTKPAGLPVDDGYYWNVLYRSIGKDGLNAVSSPVIIFNVEQEIPEDCDAEQLEMVFALKVDAVG